MIETQELYSFEPNWISPPGDTIVDILEERKISYEELAELMEVPYYFVVLLIRGVSPINELVATKLEKALGSTADFWLRRQEFYNSELLRLRKKGFINYR